MDDEEERTMMPEVCEDTFHRVMLLNKTSALSGARPPLGTSLVTNSTLIGRGVVLLRDKEHKVLQEGGSKTCTVQIFIPRNKNIKRSHVTF